MLGPLGHDLPASEYGCWVANIQHCRQSVVAVVPSAGDGKDLLYFHDFPHIMAEGCVWSMNISNCNLLIFLSCPFLSLRLGPVVEKPLLWLPGLPSAAEPPPRGRPGGICGLLFQMLSSFNWASAGLIFLSALLWVPCFADTRFAQSWLILWKQI